MENKECEYCKHDMEGKSIEDKYTIETMVDDVFLYNWCRCGAHTVDRIYYCPMCGRKLDEELNIPTGLTTPEEHEKYLKFGGEIKIIDPDTGRNLVIGEKGFYWENTEGEEDGE
jgi:hypothetical protein